MPWQSPAKPSARGRSLHALGKKGGTIGWFSEYLTLPFGFGGRARTPARRPMRTPVRSAVVVELGQHAIGARRRGAFASFDDRSFGSGSRSTSRGDLCLGLSLHSARCIVGNMAIGSLYRCLLEAARELGVDTARILEDELSLTEAALLAPEARLAPELGRKLALSLVRAAGDPELGLLAAERIQLADLDVFGYLLWHSSDLCSLFESLVSYAPLIGDTAEGTFERSKSALTLRIGRSGGRFFIPEGGDLAVGAAARLVREWSSGQAKLREVHLVRGRPRDARRYQRFFGAPLHSALLSAPSSTRTRRPQSFAPTPIRGSAPSCVDKPTRRSLH